MVCNKKKENRFSLNGNGILSSFLGWQFYRSNLYLIKAEAGKKGIHAFLKEREPQTSSFRIRTRIGDSISNDDDRYAQHTYYALPYT